MADEIQRLNVLIEKKNNEIRALGGEVQDAQENIRLSAQQAGRLTSELNDYRARFGAEHSRSRYLQEKMRKLAGENAALGDEMRGAQENLRLSAGTLSKLQGEFKGVCGELDEAKKRLGGTEEAWKRMKAEFENKVALLTQECEDSTPLL